MMGGEGKEVKGEGAVMKDWKGNERCRHSHAEYQLMHSALSRDDRCSLCADSRTSLLGEQAYLPVDCEQSSHLLLLPLRVRRNDEVQFVHVLSRRVLRSPNDRWR